jgi:hypothetical protein
VQTDDSLTSSILLDQVSLGATTAQQDGATTTSQLQPMGPTPAAEMRRFPSTAPLVK